MLPIQLDEENGLLIIRRIQWLAPVVQWWKNNSYCDGDRDVCGEA